MFSMDIINFDSKNNFFSRNVYIYIYLGVWVYVCVDIDYPK